MKFYTISKKDREYARKLGIKLVYKVCNEMTFIIACKYGKKPTTNNWLVARGFCNSKSVRLIAKLEAKDKRNHLTFL